jgi:hypothetical protein
MKLIQQCNLCGRSFWIESLTISIFCQTCIDIQTQQYSHYRKNKRSSLSLNNNNNNININNSNNNNKIKQNRKNEDAFSHILIDNNVELNSHKDNNIKQLLNDHNQLKMKNKNDNLIDQDELIVNNLNNNIIVDKNNNININNGQIQNNDEEIISNEIDKFHENIASGNDINDNDIYVNYNEINTIDTTEDNLINTTTNNNNINIKDVIVIDDDCDNNIINNTSSSNKPMPNTSTPNYKNAMMILMENSRKKTTSGFIPSPTSKNSSINKSNSSNAIPNAFDSILSGNHANNTASSKAGQGGWGNKKIQKYPNMSTYAPAFKQIKVGSMLKPIIVDGFHYSSRSLSDCYFLTHFHGDHYDGLDASFDSGSIYCSVATAALCRLKLGLKGIFLLFILF